MLFVTVVFLIGFGRARAKLIERVGDGSGGGDDINP